MAKGQREAADNSLKNTNAIAGSEQDLRNTMTAPYTNNASSMFGVAAPIVQQMTQNPGYDTATKANMRNDVFGGVNEAFDATQQNAQNRVARTGNSAGFADMSDSLARSKAQTNAQTAGGLDVQFANEAERQKEAGLSAASGLYNNSADAASKMFGIGSDTMSKLYGLAPSTLQARAAGQNGAQQFADVFSALKPKGV